MIDYKLAEELKDAGFPQTGKSCHYWHGKDTVTPEKYDSSKMYVPCLEELIEACGKALWYLNRDALGKWVAMSWSLARPAGGGNTPEEAVARLWLELNENI